MNVIVSSDHDHLGDFGPALAALGLGERIRVLQVWKELSFMRESRYYRDD